MNQNAIDVILDLGYNSTESSVFIIDFRFNTINFAGPGKVRSILLEDTVISRKRNATYKKWLSQVRGKTNHKFTVKLSSSSIMKKVWDRRGFGALNAINNVNRIPAVRWP